MSPNYEAAVILYRILAEESANNFGACNPV